MDFKLMFCDWCREAWPVPNTPEEISSWNHKHAHDEEDES
jgi:hypothetical protein